MRTHPTCRWGACLSILWIALGVGGCAPDLLGNDHDVEGRLLHAPEDFRGKLVASISGSGTMELTSDKGAECGGRYEQVPDDSTGEIRAAEMHESGRATLTCSDGRTGTVLFTIGADGAVGTGMLGQDIVTLAILE